LARSWGCNSVGVCSYLHFLEGSQHVGRWELKGVGWMSLLDGVLPLLKTSFIALKFVVELQLPKPGVCCSITGELVSIPWSFGLVANSFGYIVGIAVNSIRRGLLLLRVLSLLLVSRLRSLIRGYPEGASNWKPVMAADFNPILGLAALQPLEKSPLILQAPFSVLISLPLGLCLPWNSISFDAVVTSFSSNSVCCLIWSRQLQSKVRNDLRWRKVNLGALCFRLERWLPLRLCRQFEIEKRKKKGRENRSLRSRTFPRSRFFRSTVMAERQLSAHDIFWIADSFTLSAQRHDINKGTKWADGWPRIRYWTPPMVPSSRIIVTSSSKVMKSEVTSKSLRGCCTWSIRDTEVPRDSQPCPTVRKAIRTWCLS
jgi:hypothetical protein